MKSVICVNWTLLHLEPVNEVSNLHKLNTFALLYLSKSSYANNKRTFSDLL